MKVGALNQLKGKIVKHVPGAANTEVVFETPGGAQTVSTITKGRQSHQDLYVSQETYAIIKAPNVMAAVGHCEESRRAPFCLKGENFVSCEQLWQLW